MSQQLRKEVLDALRQSPNARWLILPGPVTIADSFVDALLSLIERREAIAWDEGYHEGWRFEHNAPNPYRTGGHSG